MNFASLSGVIIFTFHFCFTVIPCPPEALFPLTKVGRMSAMAFTSTYISSSVELALDQGDGSTMMLALKEKL